MNDMDDQTYKIAFVPFTTWERIFLKMGTWEFYFCQARDFDKGSELDKSAKLRKWRTDSYFVFDNIRTLFPSSLLMVWMISLEEHK